VGENRGINVPGTRLRRCSDLGIEVSEGVEASLLYHVTSEDALRGTVLYTFLDGTKTLSHPITYNGLTIPAGRLHTNADVARLSLAYERRLLPVGAGGSLTGSLGLTYVYFDPSINGNAEDFYAQELPVPIVGLRLDYPLGARLALTASLSGGGLPRVDSLRTEGGTVSLQQAHVDAGLGLSYALSPALRVEAGYRFTYFRQHEDSHEDNNEVELLDNGVRLGLSYRF
jgi:opacity protein-like surface antigen